MIIFKDIITDDELISDAYKIIDKGVLYEVDAKRVTKNADNIPRGEPTRPLKRPMSCTDDAATTVIDVADAFRLSPVPFDKKGYTSALKAYMKSVVEKLKAAGKSEEEVKEFQTGAQAAAKPILGGFKDYETYTGESMNPDGMIVLLNYREDGVTPYFTFWKHGLKEMKL
ncbi:translationally controlled tumor protein [Nannizzia gypsea CBS 118893]|uniref:Translationally-controlled tumor protein homolog n=1 Tax=Arthroderma gypseum (strain ATCC MYA-4604 / CBS 118893) TaxID=535722 RepID=E4V2I9_ARTGP|nr:translationally controlled tumor protein [Nannizzia gypsea CBS 118893]EFR04254.1 translationally controlled tumor protein [Nannizzia gypsea CBS 118893]